MKSKKILFIDSGNGIGGSSKYLVDLFKSLDRNRYEPLLAYYREGLNFEKIRKSDVKAFNLGVTLGSGTLGHSKGITAYLSLLGDFLFVMIPAAMKIAGIVRREKIDLLHLNNEILTHIPAILAGKLTSRPTVCYFQGYRQLTRIEKMFGKLTDAFMALSVAGAKLFERQLGRTVEPVHLALDLGGYKIPEAGSEKQSQKEIAASPSGTRDDETGSAVILNEVKDPGLRTFPPKSVAGQGDNRHGPAVGIVGRLVPWKGQDVFIRAAAAVLKKYPETKFVIIGDDAGPGKPFRRKLEAMVQSLRLEKHVLFPGWCRDVPKALSELDLVVHASTEPEPFGLVLIEAMAMGKPVIGTNAGGVPEILSDGTWGEGLETRDKKQESNGVREYRSDGETSPIPRYTDTPLQKTSPVSRVPCPMSHHNPVSPCIVMTPCGILVAPGDVEAMADAMIKILSDAQMAQSMGQAGRRRVEQCFDIRRNAAKVCGVYERLLS